MIAERASDELLEQWKAAWPHALEVWSRFTRLKDPKWCLTGFDAQSEGLQGTIAMIRLNDHTVVIDLRRVREWGVEDYAIEVLAHEIGHHVFVPANLSDNARALARIRRRLPTVESSAPQIANLYYDLLINNRLERTAKLRLHEVYQRMPKDGSSSKLWALYMRIYEILWSLKRGTLTSPSDDPKFEGDAQIGAKIVQVFARDWIPGSGKFAALCLPYLLDDQSDTVRRALKSWNDTGSAGEGGFPDGLTDIEEGEDDDVAPWDDPILTDEESGGTNPRDASRASKKSSTGQHRTPFQYREILKATGVNLSDHDIAVRYYRELASRHLIAFPRREYPESTDPLPEGLEEWMLGDPLEDAEYLQSAMLFGTIIPGVTLMKRVWGTSQGALPEHRPVNLDLYIDSSGSMPNPQVDLSYLTLGGAIVALSALRAGSKVQATLWSSKNQVTVTNGFVRDEGEILRVITGSFQGGTQFPLPTLRETYRKRVSPTHIMVISDNGIDTILEKDENGTPGADICRTALRAAAGGGSLLLNVTKDWATIDPVATALKHEIGWHIYPVETWPDLTDFCRDFARDLYGTAGK